MLRSYWGLTSNIEIGACYAVVMKLTSVSVVFPLLEGFFDNAIYDIAQDFGHLSTSNKINLNRDTCFNAMPTINLMISCNRASRKR